MKRQRARHSEASSLRPKKSRGANGRHRESSPEMRDRKLNNPLEKCKALGGDVEY